MWVKSMAKVAKPHLAEAPPLPLLQHVSCNKRSSRYAVYNPHPFSISHRPTHVLHCQAKQLAAAIRKCYQLRNAWRLTKWTLMASWQPTNSISSGNNNSNNSSEDNNKIIAMESIRKTWQRAHPFPNCSYAQVAARPQTAAAAAAALAGDEAIGIVEEVRARHLGTLKLNCKLNIKVVRGQNSEMSS